LQDSSVSLRTHVYYYTNYYNILDRSSAIPDNRHDNETETKDDHHHLVKSIDLFL
jgi:hypothetical protein